MIKRANELKVTPIENMKGGKGTVYRTTSVDAGEYDGKVEVLGRLLLQPGVSIGEHVHENNEEIMTILTGSVKYTDDGTDCILNAGDVGICRKGHSHCVENISESEDATIFISVNTVDD